MLRALSNMALTRVVLYLLLEWIFLLLCLVLISKYKLICSLCGSYKDKYLEKKEVLSASF